MRKTLVKIACALAPKRMIHFAFDKLANPQIHKLRELEEKILNESSQEMIRFNDFEIATYKWGSGEKKILLIHGWEGQAGNFADIIPRLVADNFTVYAFDGPSHGKSSRAATSLFDFSLLTKELIQKFNTNYLISHSFGGVATTYALSLLPEQNVERYCLLTTPDKFSERIDEVAMFVGISNKVKQGLIDKIETTINMPISVLDVSQFVQKVNVEKALILHDKNDKIIHVKRSQNVASHWPVCALEEIEGTGHFRILRTDFVIDRVVKFLT